ncbi:MAG: ATP-binding cassette domain-containing protein [Thermofilum sp.]|nr:ATP-binding cassette domain-containing protein [Thermofilum sp.]
MSHATMHEILRVEKLKVYFPLKRTIEDIVARRQRFLKAVDNVSFNMPEGAIMALVGESGSGKTTIARTVVGLVEPIDGHVYFRGRDIFSLKGEEFKVYRRKVQMIFQDPAVSLNPRMKIGDQVKYPLDVNKIGTKEERVEKTMKVLKDVGLSPPEDFYNRYPHQLSGGQKQRVAIARALVLEPELLIADEPISNIDVSARAQILNLLQQLRDRLHLSILYITHDLSSAWAISDQVAVMYLGKIVEMAPTSEIFSNPLHPYTQALISAAPSLNGFPLARKTKLRGEIPSPVNPPSGCRLHPRCPFAMPVCREKEPEIITLGRDHIVACHLYSKS